MSGKNYLGLLCLCISFLLAISTPSAAGEGIGDKYKLIIINAPAAGVNVDTIDIQISGVVQDKWGNPVPGVGVEVVLGGETYRTYTEKTGEFFFSILPDMAGTYTAVVSVPEFGLTETLSGIGYDPNMFKVGGIYDPHQLYYDYDRQFGHPDSMYNFIQNNHDYLRWTHFRIELADESFDWEASNGNRQFPDMTGDLGSYGQATFPWYDPNQTMTATAQNNAANPLNPLFFQRMRSFINRYTCPTQMIGQPYRAPLKVIVCVIDPWLMKHATHENNPWMKAAETMGYNPGYGYRNLLRVLPTDIPQEEIAQAFDAYLEMLAQHLGQMTQASQSLVYIEFNNEMCWYTEDPVVEPFPSNDWLFQWLDRFYVKLVNNGAQEIARKMMVNTFIGDPSSDRWTYKLKCWCDRPVWAITGVPQIRNQFISGHQCGSPGDVENFFCEYLDANPPAGENCDCNRRISFFTEGGVNAGGDGCDDFVYEALTEDANGRLRYHFALGYNNQYRQVAPWGECDPMSSAVNINEGILCAVVNAKDGNLACVEATCD